MDYRSLTSLLLRLTGVIIIVSTVVSTPRTFVYLLSLRAARPTGNIEVWPAVVAASAFPILVGLLLIYFPATVANRVVSPSTETADTLRLQQVAFSVLGVYFVTVAAYDAVYWWAKLRVYFAVYNELNFGQPFRLTNEDFAGLASTGTQFLAGVLLIFGGRGFANLIHRLRSPPALD